MNCVYKLVLLFFFLHANLSFSLEKNLPENVLYGAITTNPYITSMVYKILPPQMKTVLFPNGEKNSSLNMILEQLKNMNIPYIEYLSHKDWGILIKIESTETKKIAELFSSILQKENFDPQIQIQNENNITISSKNKELSDNNPFIIKTDNNSTLITMNPIAIQAWNARKINFKYLSQAESLITKPNSIGFFYAIDNTYAVNRPTLITLSNNQNKLDITFTYKDVLPSINLPTFLNDEPVLYFSSFHKMDTNQLQTINNLFGSLYALVPSLYVPMNLLLNQNTGIKKAALALKKGTLLNINEQKYNELDLAIAFEYNDINKVKTLITNTLKNSKQQKIDQKTLKQGTLITLTPANNQDTYLFLSNNHWAILSLNKTTINSIIDNISNNKNTLTINSQTNNTLMYINMQTLLDRFPILKSLLNQVGLDPKMIKDIQAYNDFKAIDTDNITHSMSVVLL